MRQRHRRLVLAPLAMDFSLATIDAVQAALQQATSVAEVKTIRDKAEALRAFAKQAGEGLELQNRFAEFKLRSERRAGELLAKMQKAKGGRPSGNRSHDVTGLSDLGISKMQSSRWQTIAAVPVKVFEEFIRRTKEAGIKELTSREAYQLGKSAKSKTVDMPQPRVQGVTGDLSEIVAGGQKFGTIYADPPWEYDNTATRSNVKTEYKSTMTVSEICELPVAKIAAKDAHLHLWVTKDFIFEAQRVIEAWGFEYRSMFVWCKPQMGIGNYWRVSHELMLLGIRGNAKSFRKKDLPSWGVYDRTEHSVKPSAIRDIIEDVSPGPYLELFGRERVEGWTVFGNQVATHIQRRLA